VPVNEFFGSSLDALPPGGIFITALVVRDEDYPNPPSNDFPDRQLPLQLSDAIVNHTWEVQQNPTFSSYLIMARVLSQYLDVWVFFGNRNPSPSQWAEAQSELNHLVVPLVVLPSPTPS
jgi:hypothetical protein